MSSFIAQLVNCSTGLLRAPASKVNLCVVREESFSSDFAYTWGRLIVIRGARKEDEHLPVLAPVTIMTCPERSGS